MRRKLAIAGVLFLFLAILLWSLGFYSNVSDFTNRYKGTSCFLKRPGFLIKLDPSSWTEDIIAAVEPTACNQPQDLACILGVGPLDTHPGEEQVELFARVLAKYPDCLFQCSCSDGFGAADECQVPGGGCSARHVA